MRRVRLAWWQLYQFDEPPPQIIRCNLLHHCYHTAPLAYFPPMKVRDFLCRSIVFSLFSKLADFNCQRRQFDLPLKKYQFCRNDCFHVPQRSQAGLRQNLRSGFLFSQGSFAYIEQKNQSSTTEWAPPLPGGFCIQEERRSDFHGIR